MYALFYSFGFICRTNHCGTPFSGMVYQDAEKLYAEVREDTEALVEKALAVLYPGSFPLSAGPVSASGPLTIFAHNTTPFARRDIVRVPLADGGISSGSVLQTSSDGNGGFVVLEGGAGGGLVLPTQISGKDVGGAQTRRATIDPCR
jgi:alpha-mannosidase